MKALVEDATSEDGARDAGRLFMWTGFAAVLATCVYGLALNLAFIVVASVLAMIGYVVVGWSLTRRDAEAGGVLAGIALGTLTFTMALIGGEVLAIGLVPISLGVLPALGVVLAYAAGTILARALVVKHPSLVVDLDDRKHVGYMIQAATVLLILSPFLFSWMQGFEASGPLVAATAFLAAYASAAGHLASQGRVPHHIVAGSVLALLGGAWFVIQFSSLGVATLQRAIGQVVALGAMLLAAFPVALGIVALQEMRQDLVESEPAPEEAASE